MTVRVVELVKTVPLSVFTPEIQLALPDVPTDIIESYVRQVAIEIAEDSHLLRRELRIMSQAGCDTYMIDAGDCTHVLKIIRICDSTGREWLVTPDLPCDVPCGVGITEWCCTVPAPGALPFSRPLATFKQPNELIFRPAPDCEVDIGLVVTVSVAPDRDACEVDEILYQRYAPTIHAGVMYYLLKMPNKPWTSGVLSQIEEKRYRSMRARAHADALVGAAGAVHRLRTRRIV